MTLKHGLALSATVLLITTSLVIAQDSKQERQAPTSRFQCGVLTDETNLVAVTHDGRLLATNVVWGGERDYGTFGKEFHPALEVANDKAYLLTDDQVCEVDLATGRIVRTAKHHISNGRAGVIDEHLVFIHNGRKLEIIDLDRKSTLHSIILRDENGGLGFGPTTFPHARSKDRLYVSVANEKEIAVVDLRNGELIEKIGSPFGWNTGLVVAAGKLYASKLGISYGIVQERLIAIDLETRKWQNIELPSGDKSARERLWYDDESYVPISMVTGQEGRFCLSARQGVFQFDKDGKLVARAAPLQPGQRLIAVAGSVAVAANADGAEEIEFSAIETDTNRVQQ